MIQHSELFGIHPELFDDPLCDAESQVDLEAFTASTEFVQTQDESFVTDDNFGSHGALAEEFWIPRLFGRWSEIDTTLVNNNAIRRFLVLEESASQQSKVNESLERDSPRDLCDFLVG